MTSVMTEPQPAKVFDVWPKEIYATRTSDGRGGYKWIQAGDRVQLLPSVLPGEKAENGKSINPDNHRLIREWLGGEGPFTVDEISFWPCGRAVFFFQISKGRSLQATATCFMCMVES